MIDAVIPLDPQDAAERDFSLLLDVSLRLSVPNLFSGGYKWDVVADAAALAVSKEPAAALDDPAPGSAPPVVFAVRALAPGRHLLALELRRPWEDAPAKVLRIRVTAHRPTLLDGLARPAA